MPIFFLSYPLIPCSSASSGECEEGMRNRREDAHAMWDPGFASEQQQPDHDGTGLGADPQLSWISFPEVTDTVVCTEVVF